MEQSIDFCTSADGTRIAHAARMGPLVAGTRPPPPAHPLRPTGLRLSDRRPSDYSLEARVQGLEAVVDSLRLPQFDLFGHSQGLVATIEYATRHPERVSRMVLFGSFAKRSDARSFRGKPNADACSLGSL